MRRIPERLQAWIEARKRHHLSHAQVQMARELGMNAKKLGKLDNHDQEPWKLPRFIEHLYLKRFGKAPARQRRLDRRTRPPGGTEEGWGRRLPLAGKDLETTPAPDTVDGEVPSVRGEGEVGAELLCQQVGRLREHRFGADDRSVPFAKEPRARLMVLLAPIEQGDQGPRVEQQLTGHDGETR